MHLEVFLAVLGVIVLVVLIMVGTAARAYKAQSEPDGESDVAMTYMAWQTGLQDEMELDETEGFWDMPEDHPYGSGVRCGAIEGERPAEEITEAGDKWRDRWSDFRMCKRAPI